MEGDEFCGAFGVAEHADGVGGFVGGDVHESFYATADGSVEDVEGAVDVGFDGFGWVHLKEGEVFECGGVKDDFGFAFVEELQDGFCVADVGEDEVGGVEECSAFDGELYGVEGLSASPLSRRGVSEYSRSGSLSDVLVGGGRGCW